METVDINVKEKGHGDKSLAFCVDVLKGLSSSPKSLSSKYFYDQKGSKLFQEITRQEEYYLTRAEAETLQSNKSEIVANIHAGAVDVVELGAGDGHKTKILLDELVKQEKNSRFFPIDISQEAMIQLSQNIKNANGLETCGIVGEYLPGLSYIRERSSKPMLILFLGSNIGNFLPSEREVFLKKISTDLNDGDQILIGFDLKKDIRHLLAAYNDSAGVTERFNLNLLERMNRELGADFNLKKFQHYGTYNPLLGAMESYLLSLEEQEVFIKEFGKSFHFSSFEPLRLEYSFKFSLKEIENLAVETGFRPLGHYRDKKEFFVDSLWEVKKEPFYLH